MQNQTYAGAQETAGHGQIDAEAAQLQKQLESLHGYLSTLGARLDGSVCRPHQPQPADTEPESKRAAHSPYAERLINFQNDVMILELGVRDMLDRLEA